VGDGVAPKQPEPTLKDILQTIRKIVHGEPKQPKPPRRGLSPGLLLMAIVALLITIAAAVKNMK
jgi:hypothetical protein